MTDQPKPNDGKSLLRAYARQGLAEIRAALYPESNIAQPVDPGMWGNLTQGEIADQREGDAEKRGAAEEREPGWREDVLGKYTTRDAAARAAEREAEHERPEDRSPERE
jgi:hypothetical protein